MDIGIQLNTILKELFKHDFKQTDKLLNGGIVDSIGAVDLLMAIEEKMGIIVPITEAELILSDVQSLLEYLQHHEK